jgi:hypothetical protein
MRDNLVGERFLDTDWPISSGRALDPESRFSCRNQSRLCRKCGENLSSLQDRYFKGNRIGRRRSSYFHFSPQWRNLLVL